MTEVGGCADTETIRGFLTARREQIESVGYGGTSGFWVGDKAAERQALDDQRSGRLAWKSAHRHVVQGLADLERGDADAALMNLLVADAFMIEALGARLRVRPSDLALLAKPAGSRNRPKKIESRQKN